MTALYIDSSALLKRVVLETESSAVRALLRHANTAGDLLTTSSLSWLEVWRALRRGRLSNVPAMTRRALAGIAEFPLDDEVLSRARRIGDDTLRTLDAIHLASAVAVGADCILTYDSRLADSATGVGISVLAPTQ